MNIYCYGDSNTYGYDPRGFLADRYDLPWPKAVAQITGWTVSNNGVCGRRVPATEAGFPKNADLILVMLGANDLLNGDAPRAIAEKIARFLSGLDPSKAILIAPPTLCRGEWVPDDDLIRRSAELAEEYRTVADCLGIRFLDAGVWRIPLCFDGVHFTEAGHRIFAEHLVQALQNDVAF